MKYSILVLSLLIAFTFASIVDEKCTADNACKVSNSTCIRNPQSTCVYGDCKCQSGYWPSTDKKKCHKTVEFNANCTAPGGDKPCDPQKHLICGTSPSKCKCKDGYERPNNQCVLKPVGYKTEECFISQQCTKDGLVNAVCTTNPNPAPLMVCLCAPGYMENAGGNNCIEKPTHDENCATGDVCNNVKKLVCNGGKCLCPNDHIWGGNDGCVGVATGSNCVVDSNVKICVDLNAECNNANPRKCACKTNYKSETVNIGGQQVSRCIHENAQPNLDHYEICNEDAGEDGKFCKAGLICEACSPSNPTTTRICLERMSSSTTSATTTATPASTTTQNSGTTLSFSFLSVVISSISALVLLLRI